MNSFWVSKENIASDKKYRFCHPIGQMDLSCPWTVQNKILQKCRETIPLVQACFRFDLFFYRFEVIVKNLGQPVKFLPNFRSFWRFSLRDGVRRIYYYRIIPNYTRIHNSWKFCENRSSSFWERTVNLKKTFKKLDNIPLRRYGIGTLRNQPTNTVMPNLN